MCRIDVQSWGALMNSLNSVNSAELPKPSLGFHVTFESRRRPLLLLLRVNVGDLQLEIKV